MIYYNCYCIVISWPQLVSQEISDSLTGNQQSRSVGIADTPYTSSALSRRQSSPQKTSEDQYMACESRVASFTRSWPHNSGNLTPQRMALAGFYYSGELKKRFNGPLTRYTKLRVAGESFSRLRLQRKLLASDPDMHHGTCVTHVSCCISGSLTRGGGGKHSRHPGACATRNFTYLARGSWHESLSRYRLLWVSQSVLF